MSDGVLSLRPWDRIIRSARRRAEVEALIDQPEAPKAIAALPELDAYVLAKELGTEDATALLRWMSTDQLRALFDFESWQTQTLSPADVFVWLDACREADLSCFLRAVRGMDPEALAACLRRRLRVAVRPSEDDPAHQVPSWLAEAEELHETPDGRFVFEARRVDERDEAWDEVEEVDEEQRKTALRIVEDLYRDEDMDWAASIMRLAESDLSSSLEELSLRFRDARLEDLGFPPRERALLLWAPLGPEALSGTEQGEPAPGRLPVAVGRHLRAGLLAEALERAPELTNRVESELASLVTGLLVAEGVALADRDGLAWIVATALGRIDLGLSAGLESEDPGVWTERLRGHDLRTLFGVGHGVLLGMRRRVQSMGPLNELGLESDLLRLLEGLDQRIPVDADPTRAELPRPVAGPAVLAVLGQALSHAEALGQASALLGLQDRLQALEEPLLPVDPRDRTLRVALTTGAAWTLLGAPFEVRPLDGAALERLAVRLAAGASPTLPSLDEAMDQAVARELSVGLEQLRGELLGRAGAQVDPRFVEAVLRVA
ncbi:MAG: DUF6178 family protein [Myxococcota bacterium]